MIEKFLVRPVFLVSHARNRGSLIRGVVWPGGFARWYREYPPGYAANVSSRFLVLINAAFVGLALVPPLHGATPRGLALLGRRGCHRGCEWPVSSNGHRPHWTVLSRPRDRRRALFAARGRWRRTTDAPRSGLACSSSPSRRHRRRILCLVVLETPPARRRAECRLTIVEVTSDARIA